jgi:predicted small lipoprotein YifL
MTRAIVSVLIVAVMAAGLAACGKQGDLERPGPLWGDKAKADYAEQQRKAAEQKKASAQDNQPEPLPPDNSVNDVNAATP